MITPTHPNLHLDRALTRDEMLAAVRHEGMFGLDPRDEPVARVLETEGLVSIDKLQHGQLWVVNAQDTTAEQEEILEEVGRIAELVAEDIEMSTYRLGLSPADLVDRVATELKARLADA